MFIAVAGMFLSEVDGDKNHDGGGSPCVKERKTDENEEPDSGRIAPCTCGGVQQGK
jgi:hypothetical protein